VVGRVLAQPGRRRVVRLAAHLVDHAAEQVVRKVRIQRRVVEVQQHGQGICIIECPDHERRQHGGLADATHAVQQIRPAVRLVEVPTQVGQHVLPADEVIGGHRAEISEQRQAVRQRPDPGRLRHGRIGTRPPVGHHTERSGLRRCQPGQIGRPPAGAQRSVQCALQRGRRIARPPAQSPQQPGWHFPQCEPPPSVAQRPANAGRRAHLCTVLVQEVPDVVDLVRTGQQVVHLEVHQHRCPRSQVRSRAHGASIRARAAVWTRSASAARPGSPAMAACTNAANRSGLNGRPRSVASPSK
jgi:hypothetical protein